MLRNLKSISLIALTSLCTLPLNPALAQSRPPTDRPAATPFPALDIALQSAQAAIAACKGYKVSTAVVDSSGELKVELATDGAMPLTAELAWRKARTAAYFKRPTSEAKKDPKIEFALSSVLYSYYGGGYPLIDKSGTLIGAIAISGGASEAGDEACAKAGADKWASLTK
jgi:uncharacterized protein GlcG (DUF336 family)